MSDKEESVSALFEQSEQTISDYDAGKCDNERLKQTVETLDKLQIMIRELDLFSSNKEFPELPSSSLRYLLVPAYLGYALENENDLDNRSNYLKAAKVDWISEEGEVIPESDEPVVPPKKDHAVETERKIGRSKAEKELANALKKLEIEKRRNNDEATMREAVVVQLRLWALKVVNELQMIDEELPLLAYRQKVQSREVKNQRPQPPLVKLSPFVIAKNEKQRKVFGLGYPSLPTYTVDQWCDKIVKSGKFGKIENLNVQRIDTVDDNEIVAAPKDEDDKEKPKASSSKSLNRSKFLSELSSVSSFDNEKDVPVDFAALLTEKNGAKCQRNLKLQLVNCERIEQQVDPLDAYMATIETQVQLSKKAEDTQSSGIIIVDEEIRPLRNAGEIIEREDTHEGIEPKYFDISAAASQLMTKGRSLQKTDHEKVYYKSFKKDFYHEAQAIREMTEEEVEAFRIVNDEIRVRGLKCPKPILQWSHAGISRTEMSMLKILKYVKPTPIQSQMIPVILSGRDVIARSGTDHLAFIIPMLRHILHQEPLDEMDGPIALIMAATRVLALQTWREVTKFAAPMNLNVVCVYDGVGISEQIADLKKGAEIVVCSPGRMIDMLIANNGKVTNLRRITYLVLDEADHMFDMGFEPQVMKIINNIRPDRQTIMFSATFPKTMEALARKILKKPIEIQVGLRRNVIHLRRVLTTDKKFSLLLDLLRNFLGQGKVIIFVSTIEKVDDLVPKLWFAGYNCAPLHEAIDQSDRDSTLIDFKCGILKLLIVTSVAARGLDVRDVILVVNYDCPNNYESYVHHVGRIGRAGSLYYQFY